ncbi:hypothetical protein HKBW3S43_02105, partial [Candidatus Hakubella thermalkaliphila]
QYDQGVLSELLRKMFQLKDVSERD